MIFIRLYERDTHRHIGDFEPQDVSIKYAVNEIGSFEFSLDAPTFRGARIDGRKAMRAEVHVNGQPKITGLVDAITVDRGNFHFDCNDDMDELSQIRAKSNAKYQNQQVLAILADLLTYAPGWELGDLTTMEDFVIRTTLDLRSEKRLFPQIKSVVDAIPNTFLRYGGDRTIDIGKFDRRVGPPIPPDAVTKLTLKMEYTELVRMIEPYGGEIEIGEDADSMVRRSISLNDALAFDPTLTSDPDFPIVTDQGVLVVVNSNLAHGGSRVEFYKDIVPAEKRNPTSNEIAQAGYALWLRTKKDLIDSSQYDEEWSATTTYLPPGVMPGDRIYIQAYADQMFYDYVTGTVVTVPIGEVAQWFRILSYTEKISPKEGVTYDLKLTPNLRVETKDPILALYESARTPVETDDLEGALVLSTFSVISATIPPGLVANSYNTDDGETYYPAVLFNFPLGDIPSGATSVSWFRTPFSATDGVDVRIVNQPSIPSSPVTVLSVSLNKNWTPANTLTLYGLVEFT